MNAQQEVIDALTQDGICILLLSRDEILALTDTGKSVELLKSKYWSRIIKRQV